MQDAPGRTEPIVEAFRVEGTLGNHPAPVRPLAER